MWPPNWLENAYPAAEDLNDREWAWEFLRRNPQYQQMWADLIRPFWDSAEQSFDDDAAVQAEHTKAGADPAFQHLMSGADEGSYEVSSPLKQFRDTFAVMMVPPPAEHAGGPGPLAHLWVSMRNRPAIKSLPADRPYPVKIDFAPAESLIVFDLSQPLENQIARATQALRNRQVYLQKVDGLQLKPRRNNRELWPCYLRLLDAEAAGADIRQMPRRSSPTTRTSTPTTGPTKKCEIVSARPSACGTTGIAS
jgi:hypothetical protein